jgi:hypothetical protein
MPASLFAQEDFVQLTAPDGRVGVWIEEKALGDVLAGIEQEKGKERQKAEVERQRADTAERALQREIDSQKPARLFLTYGLPSGLVAAAIAAIAAFFGGLAAGKGVR